MGYIIKSPLLRVCRLATALPTCMPEMAGLSLGWERGYIEGYRGLRLLFHANAGIVPKLVHLYCAHFSSSSSNSSRASTFIVHTSLHHPAIRLVHPPLLCTLLFIIRQFVSCIQLYCAHFSSSSSNSSRASTFIVHTSLNHPAIRLVHPPLFCTLLFIIQPHKQKSNVVGSADSNMTISVTIQNYTRIHTNFFLSQWPIESHLKIPNFLPDSACIYRPTACCHTDNLTFCTHSIYVTRVIIKINNDFTTQI